MKQGKNPTVDQKIWLTGQGLKADEWLIVKWTTFEATVKHRTTGEVKVLTR